MKIRIVCGLLLDEIQKIPLRHKAEKLAVRRQVSEVCERDRFITNLSAEFSDLLMRPFEELFDQAKFVDDFERRWMNRIAAKVAKEISVLLEHDYRDARARQQKPEHHSGWATTCNTAARAYLSFVEFQVVKKYERIASSSRSVWSALPYARLCRLMCGSAPRFRRAFIMN